MLRASHVKPLKRLRLLYRCARRISVARERAQRRIDVVVCGPVGIVEGFLESFCFGCAVDGVSVTA